jgi:hypothetical protein
METTVWLTPDEAASGAVKTIMLPTGPVSVRIPPVGDNALINVPTDEGEVSVRVRVADMPSNAEAPTSQMPSADQPFAPPFGAADPAAQVPSGEEPTAQMPPDQSGVPPFGAAAQSPFDPNASGPGGAPPWGAAAPPPYGTPPYGTPPYGMPPRRPWYQKPGPWIAIGIVALAGSLIGFAVAGSSSNIVVANPTSTASPLFPTSTGSASPALTPTPTSPAVPTTLAPTPSSISSPLAAGQCLSGTLPNSATPVDVTGVSVIDCSSPDATYKIIQTFYDSDDLNDCNSVSSSQSVYAFSDEETLDGAELWEAVYCAVQL